MICTETAPRSRLAQSRPRTSPSKRGLTGPDPRGVLDFATPPRIIINDPYPRRAAEPVLPLIRGGQASTGPVRAPPLVLPTISDDFRAARKQAPDPDLTRLPVVVIAARRVAPGRKGVRQAPNVRTVAPTTSRYRHTHMRSRQPVRVARCQPGRVHGDRHEDQITDRADRSNWPPGSAADELPTQTCATPSHGKEQQALSAHTRSREPRVRRPARVYGDCSIESAHGEERMKWASPFLRCGLRPLPGYSTARRNTRRRPSGSSRPCWD